MIEQSKWKWFGLAGHFICGPWCRFHLCTQVGKYLVSTVGEYVHPRHSGGNERKEQEWLKQNPLGEDIGIDRKYETMVFAVGKPSIEGAELDMRGYNSRKDAGKGHSALCLKWANKQ